MSLNGTALLAPAPRKESPAPSEESAAPTVLIVDDSPVDRHIAAAIVGRDKKWRAVTACDGHEALLQVAREAPAVVITDLQMPGMDGLELVEEIRRLHPGIPVILMTAHGSEEIAMKALRAGAANYVPKKAMRRELADTLDRVLTASAVDLTRKKLMQCVEASRRQLRLENDPALIAPLIALLQEDLDAMGLCDENQRTRIGVAIQEALSNALYHGNLGVSSDLRQEDESLFYLTAEARRRQEPFCGRKISIFAEIDRSAAVLRIRDEGEGFDTAALDAPFDPESLMRVGGRGMLLIRTFMDEVQHNAQGNEITLIKRRAAAG